MTCGPAVNLLGFVRRILVFISDWDGRHKLTRPELERAQAWWHESNACCPEAAAIDIRAVYPDELPTYHER